MSIVTPIISVLRSPVQFGAFCFLLFVSAMLYVGFLLNNYYQQQERQTLQQQLSQYHHQLDTKLAYVGHLLYSIDAYLDDGFKMDLFNQVAQSQLPGGDVELRLEMYRIIKPEQVQSIEVLQRQLGFFDYTVRLQGQISTHYLTLMNVAPLADYGHTMGDSLAFSDAQIDMLYEHQSLMAVNWSHQDKWTLLLQRPDHQGASSVLGLSFELPILLEGLFGHIYQTSQQHVRVYTDQQELFNSDWQNNYDLAHRDVGANQTIDFYGQKLTLQLYSHKQLSPSLLENRHLMIVGFITVACLCAWLVWMQLRYLVSRNNVINKIVIERTTSLAQANDRLSIESDKRLAALQQQISAERKYKSLFLNSSEGLFVLDAHGQLVDANPAFRRLLLGNENQQLGAYLSQYIVDDEFAKQWQKIIDHKSRHDELEWLAQVESADSIWLRQTGSWLHGPGGTLYEGRVTDITQLKLFNEQLKYKAQHDSLTDLLNRQTFLGLVEACRNTSAKQYVLLYIDLDRFKLINDTLGHLAGDRLLVEFATRMRILLGSFSDIARLGGDEFAVLIELDKLPMPLEGMLEDILVEVRKPFVYQQQSHSISGSVGVRRFTVPCVNYEAEKLLHDADIAMYEAKKRGKNCYYIYSSAIACEASRKLRIERALHDIDCDGELSLQFQPIYCCEGRRLRGFEALLRWHSTELGFVSPAEFIPIAEECAKINMLGQWVFKNAVSFMHECGENDLFMSVNVSPLQIQSGSFVPWLIELFSHNQVEPGQFKIELTESAMMMTEDSLVEPLEQLHELGFGIYIDDFGTGFSSLARLNALPVTGLKIDRAFIEGIENMGSARQLIEAICAIAKSFDLVVTAEGIETPEQLAVLSKLHCQQSQGYLMSKPLARGSAVSLVIQVNSAPYLELVT
ncbi:diguanylate cyclase [Pseudoalteromonas citrea]|uniref:Diguanylate cyclase n=1 Tax=Pseudoalteromonas citrea TaxID=43655 RepID=A0A5S3XSU3_9GAMM|nr:EAL domain-containing protein [Pseudoalteromonas citrea]TMP45267.1 diguanylate cyclase [Pseudoalteromonas citrea]TMP61267.1 diguanylate cyclase [Pseudoalteromonas citrea]